MWLWQVGLADTVLNWKPRILSSIFPREVFQISAWKYFCVLCSARSLQSFYFSLFCSQLVYTCSKFGYSNPKMKIVFFFFYSQVAYNCSNYIIKTRSYLSKMSLLTNNKAPLVFWANQFFQSNNIQKNKTKTKQKESFVELKNT